MTDDSRSLLLPLHIFVITSHFFLSQVLALLRNNLLKLDGRILLLGPLQDSPGPPIGKIGYAVPVALHCQISKYDSLMLRKHEGHNPYQLCRTALQDGSGPPVGKIGYAVPVALHCQISKYDSLMLNKPEGHNCITCYVQRLGIQILTQ